MSSVIEPIHLVAAKLSQDEIDAIVEETAKDFAIAVADHVNKQPNFEELAALAASSQSEQVVATIAPPIQSHVVAQIPAVDYNVDAPVEPKIINHQVLSSKIVNPA